MASRTLYGVVEAEGSEHSLSFRLHLEAGTRKDDVCLLDGEEHNHRHIGNRPALNIQDFPFANFIYERELYVSKAHDKEGHEVLNLKEGPRFLELSPGKTFPSWLVNFLI